VVVFGPLLPKGKGTCHDGRHRNYTKYFESRLIVG
jgi:hypothetical protein